MPGGPRRACAVVVCGWAKERPAGADRHLCGTTDGPACHCPRMDDAMIMVTRRNGSAFALNPDLIERVEATPDTVITLVGGTKYVVSEGVDEIIEQVREFRAAILATAGQVTPEPHRPGHLRPVTDLER